MNDKQKKVLLTIGVVVVAMLIYPPYTQPVSPQYSVSGYAFIFDQPTLSTINAPLLLVQWLGVAIVGGIGLLLFKDDQGS